jgi:chemotaxis signal transduction protein
MDDGHARTVRRPRESGQDGAVTEPYLVIILAGGEFCLRASVTREVIPWAEPRRLPTANPTLIGVVPIRGELVPVYDLAAPLGLTAERGKIVVVDDTVGKIGLAVDDVRELVQAGEEDFAPAPTASSLIDGALQVGDRIVIRLRTPLALEQRFRA